LLHRQSGGHRPAGGVLMGDGRTEEGHQPVAQEVAHRAFVTVHCFDHASNAALRERVHRLRIEPLAERCRTGGVDKQHGHGAALAFESRPVAQDLLC
jgi:hypothetical protein